MAWSAGLAHTPRGSARVSSARRGGDQPRGLIVVVLGADLPADLAAGEIARPGVGWSYTIVRMDVDIGVPSPYRVHQLAERMSGERPDQIRSGERAFGEATVDRPTARRDRAVQECHDWTVHTRRAEMNVRLDYIIDVLDLEPKL